MSQFFIGLLLISSCSVSGQAQKSFRSKTHVLKESIPELYSRTDILKQSRMSNDYHHEVVFVIRQKNMEELTDFLHDVSDPSSDNYGQHMTRTGVSDLTSNPEGRDSVKEYLHVAGAAVVAVTLGGEYITASAPIGVWEKMFNCEFYMFHQTLENNVVNKVVRTESYSIPVHLSNHVESVFHTVDIPHENVIKARFNVEAQFFTTPQKLRNAYNMGTSTGSALSTQCIYASLDEHYSPADLTRFQSTFNIPKQTVATVIGGHESDSMCISTPSTCSEANLDIQYMMAASPVSPTTYWYTDINWFSEWLTTVVNYKNPPLVFSISYGMEELYVLQSERDAFNTQAIKLGAMGVTIVAASGDDGAVTMKARGDPSKCRYMPIFPASSPYVTAVGATMGIESGTGEVACSSSASGVITTGGGFSGIHPQPKFQAKAVAKYFASAAAAKQTPVSGYNAAGRGFPDISFAGFAYSVYIGGLTYAVSGTSASSPVAAGILSNINAARMAVGKGSVGWVNPALYTNSSLYFNDITVGSNKCAATAGKYSLTCCSQGYTCTSGWDPVTGLGTINYGKMVSSFSAFGAVNSLSGIPSRAPTVRASTPSYSPTIKSSSSRLYGIATITLAVSIVTSAWTLMF